MRWIPFAILGLLAMVLQTTLVPRIAIGGIVPDLMFVLAVHYALWGSWPDVGIAACLLGFVFGTQTANPMGLHAFGYGAAVWGIVRVRQALFREHPITQLVITLIFMFLVQLGMGLYLHRLASGRVSWGQVFWFASLTAVYTAACAPYLHWLLHRVGRWTGLRTTSRGAGYR